MNSSSTKNIYLPLQFVYFTSMKDFSIHFEPKWTFAKKTPTVIKLNNNYKDKYKYLSNMWTLNCKTFQLLEFSHEFFTKVTGADDYNGNNVDDDDDYSCDFNDYLKISNKWNINNTIYDDNLYAIHDKIISNVTFKEFINRTYVYLKIDDYNNLNNTYKEVNVLIKYNHFWKNVSFAYTNYSNYLKSNNLSSSLEYSNYSDYLKYNNNKLKFEIDFSEFGNFLLSTKKYYKKYIKYNFKQKFVILWTMDFQDYFSSGIGYFFENYNNVGYKRLKKIENTNNFNDDSDLNDDDDSEETDTESIFELENNFFHIDNHNNNNNTDQPSNVNDIQQLTNMIHRIFIEQQQRAHNRQEQQEEHHGDEEPRININDNDNTNNVLQIYDFFVDIPFSNNNHNINIQMDNTNDVSNSGNIRRIENNNNTTLREIADRATMEQELQNLINNEQNLNEQEMLILEHDIIRRHMANVITNLFNEYTTRVSFNEMLEEEVIDNTSTIYKKITKELILKKTNKLCNYCYKDDNENHENTLLSIIIGNNDQNELEQVRNFKMADFKNIKKIDDDDKILDLNYLIGCSCDDQDHVICIKCLFECIYAELKTANKIGINTIVDLINFNNPHTTSQYRYCFCKQYDPQVNSSNYFNLEDVKCLTWYFPEKKKFIDRMFKNLYLTEKELEDYAKEYNWYFVNYDQDKIELEHQKRRLEEEDDENNNEPMCFNHLIKIKNLKVEEMWRQIENLLNDNSCTITCPKCFTVLEKVSDCNALRHCNIDICYICGIKSREFDYLSLDHWDSNGINGCPRYMENKYFEYKFYDYHCKEGECFDNQEECLLIDHNRGKFYLNLHRQLTLIMHMLWSISDENDYFEMLDRMKNYLDCYEFEFQDYSGLKYIGNDKFNVRKYALCKMIFDKNTNINNHYNEKLENKNKQEENNNDITTYHRHNNHI